MPAMDGKRFQSFNKHVLRVLVLFLAQCFCFTAWSQSPDSDSTRIITEKEMREAASHIVRYSGLSPNFIISGNPEVKTAVAFIKGKQRIVEYNPEAMATILDSAVTKWSAVSILAHEIAHHLNGHTLDPSTLSLGNELECDRYSGFILQKMGASLADAQSAMVIAGSSKATKTHPPKEARLEAITRGWYNACEQASEPLTTPFQENDFTHRIEFKGDPHVYYADSDSALVWLDATGEGIGIGQVRTTSVSPYILQITWEGETFMVDSRGDLWTMTPYNVWRIVGTVEEL